MPAFLLYSFPHFLTICPSTPFRSSPPANPPSTMLAVHAVFLCFGSLHPSIDRSISTPSMDLYVVLHVFQRWIFYLELKVGWILFCSVLGLCAVGCYVHTYMHTYMHLGSWIFCVGSTRLWIHTRCLTCVGAWVDNCRALHRVLYILCVDMYPHQMYLLCGIASPTELIAIYP